MLTKALQNPPTPVLVYKFTGPPFLTTCDESHAFRLGFYATTCPSEALIFADVWIVSAFA